MVLSTARSWASEIRGVAFAGAGGLLLAAALGLPTLASAQTAASGAAESSGLDEVVVTANRVEQNIQRVGAAVQVIGGEELQAQALTTINSIFADTPSVVITAQPAGYSVNIRGQMGDGPSGAQQGAVASEFDGIYNITALSTIVGFFDLNRVEVLPGPQSTQYGPNSDGGVMNVISRDPEFKNWDGDGSFTYGNYNLRRGEFAQNIPIGDNMAIRVAGAFIDRGSYFEPETTNQIAQSGRIKFLWQLNDSLTIKAWAEWDHEGGTGDGVEPIMFGSVPAYPGSSINNASYACNPANMIQYKGIDCANPWNHGDVDDNGHPLTGHADLLEATYAATVSWQINPRMQLDVTPSAIIGSGTQTGWYNFGCGGPGSGALTTVPGAPGYNPGCVYSENTQHPFDPFHEIATEVRLHSVAGDKLVWAVGYYLWDYKVDQWTTPPNPSQPYAVTSQYGTVNEDKVNAVFGDVTYPITDTFRAIAGARYSRDARTVNQVLGPDDVAFGTIDYDHFDFRLGQQWDVAPNAMEYLTYSTGFRPGAITYLANTNGFTTPGSEVNHAVELGLKSRLLDNTLQINSDAFYYFESNYQINDRYTPYLTEPPYSGYTLVGGSSNICYTQNGAAAPVVCNVPLWEPDLRAYGVETQIKYNLTPADRFTANATFEKSNLYANGGGCSVVSGLSYANHPCWYVNSGNGNGNGFNLASYSYTNIEGEVSAHSPEWSANFGYDHTFNIGGYALMLGGDAYYSDWFYAHPSVLPSYANDTQPAYWLFNASATLSPLNSKWSLNAYIRNIGNYAVKGSLDPSTTLGDPRLFGLTASLKW